MTKKQKSRSTKQTEKHQRDKKISQADESQKENAQKQENKFTLYDVLGVKKDASKEQIKKQYRSMAMICHPDKNKEDPIKAKQQFQKLKEAYDILSDDDKRKQYDQTGTYGDQFDLNAFQSAYQFYRQIYKKVTEEDIIHFEKQYREGKMEQQDLLDYYQRHQGNMVQLIQSIPCSKNEDIPRFIKFFQAKISQKAIKKYKAFDTTKNKIRKIQDESQQFQKMKEEQKKMGMTELVLAIRGKSDKHEDFLKALQEKYGGGKKKAEKQKKTKKSKKQ